MHSIHLIPNLGQGGIHVVARQIVEAIGPQTGSIFPWSLGDSVGDLTFDHVYREPSQSLWRKLRLLRVEIRQHRKCLVVCHTFRLAVLAFIASPGSARILVVHTPLSSNSDLQPLDRLWAFCAYVLSCRVVTVARGIGDEMRQLACFFRDEKVMVINNAPNLPQMNDFQLQFSKNQILDHRPLLDIWWIGRMVHQKDPLLAASIICSIDPSLRPNFRFVMAGSGELTEQVQKVFAKAGFPIVPRPPLPSDLSGVYFCGFQPNWHQYVANRSVLLCTSRWEGHPLALIEALCLGVRVISRNFTHGLSDLSCDLSSHGLDDLLIVETAESTGEVASGLTLKLENEILINQVSGRASNSEALVRFRSAIESRFRSSWKGLLVS